MNKLNIEEEMLKTDALTLQVVSELYDMMEIDYPWFTITKISK